MTPGSELAENGSLTVNGTPELTESVTSGPVKRRLSRYHESLLAAFVSGAPVREAARLAGVSERTAQRWKAIHWGEVTSAKRQAFDGLLARVRNALPIALERLESIAKNSEDEAVATRAALGLWEIFGRVADRMEVEQRLTTLEGTLLNEVSVKSGSLR